MEKQVITSHFSRLPFLQRNDDERQQLLAKAVDAVRDYAIFMLDINGQILTWNSGAELIKGYKAEEIVGKHFSLFYTSEDRERNRPNKELKTASEEGRHEEEGWRIRKDGGRFWASVVITRLEDVHGKVVGFSKVIHDLTERRRFEDALRTSEERFRQLIDGVRDYAIFLLDAKGFIATWNSGAERLKGYRPEEIIGKHFSKFYSTEDIENGKCDYELHEASITGRFEDEGWRIRKDGSRFWANVVITAVRSSKNEVTGFSKVTRDLTEKKRAEDRLRRTNEELEKRVEKRTGELLKANQELEAAILSRDEFLSVASHELKTPITSLKLQTQILKSKVNVGTGEVPTAERLAHSLNTINRQADRLNGLVEDLLDVSRVQMGKLSFQFELTDLSVLLHDVFSRWSDIFKSVDCEVQARIQPSVFCEVDGYRIEQVLNNIFSNAIKYAAGKPVEISLQAKDSFAIIRVKDQGMGIPPTLHGKIFEIYERVNDQLGISGLGLGLFITKNIVDAHHGNISVESKAGNGAEFAIQIPLKRATQKDSSR